MAMGVGGMFVLKGGCTLQQGVLCGDIVRMSGNLTLSCVTSVMTIGTLGVLLSLVVEPKLCCQDVAFLPSRGSCVVGM